MTSQPWVFSANGKIRARPLIADETVYCGSEDGCMYAVQVGAAHANWKFVTGGKILSTPALHDEALYFGSYDHFFYAVDARTGEEKWRFGTARPITASPVVWEGLLLFGGWDGYFYALDARTGSERWRVSAGGRISGTAAISEGQIFFKNRQGTIFSVAAPDGTIKHRLDAFKASTRPIVAGNNILFGSGMSMVALNQNSGRPAWAFPLHNRIISPAAVANGIACFGAGAFFYGLDVTNGMPKWEVETGSPPAQEPLITEGVAYFVTKDNGFLAIDVETGSIMYSLDMGRSKISQPAVTREWILFGSADNNLYGYPVSDWKTRETGAEAPVGIPAPAKETRLASYPVAPYSNAQRPWRLFVLGYLFPIYHIYWFYRNWKHWQLEHGERIRPGLRTLGMFIPLLDIYLAYGQFRRLDDDAREEGVRGFSLPLVTAGFALFSTLPQILSLLFIFLQRTALIEFTTWMQIADTFFYHVIAYPVVLFVLVTAQRTINSLWETRQPSLPLRNSFSGGEKLLLVIGALLLSWTIIYPFANYLLD